MTRAAVTQRDEQALQEETPPKETAFGRVSSFLTCDNVTECDKRYDTLCDRTIVPPILVTPSDVTLCGDWG